MTTDQFKSGPTGDLWSFSLHVYAEAGVAEECLSLQDSYGVNINLILMAAFAGVGERKILQVHLDDAKRCTADWHANVVCGLRRVRRAMKGLAANCSNPQEWEALRNKLKDIELKAEKEEQMALAGWMKTHAESWPKASTREAVAANLRSLFSLYEMDGNDATGASSHLLVACQKFVAAGGSKPIRDDRGS